MCDCGAVVYRVYCASRTLSGVRWAIPFIWTLHILSSIFSWENARVLFKRNVETFFAETFRNCKTSLVYGGIFAESRTVV